MGNTLAPIDVTTPLGNNEIVSFVKAIRGEDKTNDLIDAVERNAALENKKIETLGKKIDSIGKNINAQTDVINSLNDTLKNLFGLLCTSIDNSTSVAREAANRQPTIVVNPPINTTEVKSATNPLFYSSIPEKDCHAWTERVRDEIDKICKDENSERNSIYKQIYASMKTSGYDIDNLLTEYKKVNPKSNRIAMIAYSDALRECFSKHVNNYVHKHIVNKLKMQIPVKKTVASEAMHCPENVKQIVCRFAGTDNPSGVDYSRAYKLLGIDNVEFLAEARKRIGYQNMALGYAIGTNPITLSRLDRAVTEYLNKESK